MDTRPPAVAGAFYPSHKQPLLDWLEKLFGDIKDIESSCKGVISPHAGYEYCGSTAARAVTALKKFKKLIIVGPNHYLRGDDFSIMSRGVWNTPLGDCKINPRLAGDIKKSNLVSEDALSHEREHSIEVQIPLLQYRLKSFSFVPISIMNVDYSPEFLDRCVKLGKTIARIVRKGSVGVIASSDFSHYLPLSTAKQKDKKAIEKIRQLDIVGLFGALDNMHASVCGYGPIAVLMSMAKELRLKAKVIHSSTSAEATGDEDSVVSYHAIGFE